jgi:hypothetical protein
MVAARFEMFTPTNIAKSRNQALPNTRNADSYSLDARSQESQCDVIVLRL